MATYEEMLKLREILKNFPESAKEAVSVLWNKIANNWEIDPDAEMNNIARYNDVSSDNVSTYYDWYAADRPDSVVIFYNESKWFGDEPCFDSRCNNQLLPRGSVVCAIVTDKGATLLKPYLEDSQVDHFKAELEDALLAVWEFDYTAEDLIAAGSLSFSKSMSDNFNAWVERVKEATWKVAGGEDLDKEIFAFAGPLYETGAPENIVTKRIEEIFGSRIASAKEKQNELIKLNAREALPFV